MEDQIKKLIKESENDHSIIGLILVGSRGKSFENEYSDYDLVMVSEQDAVNSLKEKYTNLQDIDLAIYSLSEFDSYAAWGNPESWDRYNYAHVKILVEKSQEISRIVKEKGSIPEDKRKEYIETCIDEYVNGVYRSVKCVRSGNHFGAYIESANSMIDLIALVFALEGRHRPFLGYAQKELETYPLKRLPWPPTEFLEAVELILHTADLQAQQKFLRDIKNECQAFGYGNAIFEAWKGKDDWAMTFK